MTYKQLFNIIEDQNAREDEVDDAIIDLGEYPEEAVISFLFNLANENLEDYMLSSVAESLGEIFHNKPGFQSKYNEEIANLPDFVRSEMETIMRITK